LCDGHTLFLESLATALSCAGHDVVATATSPGAGLEAVLAHSPDVAVFGVDFPAGSGLDVLPAIRAARPAVKTVMLSPTDPPDVVAEAFRRGSSGFLRKDQHLDVILRSLEHVRCGVVVMNPQALRRVIVRQRPAPREDPRRLLTERERAVLAEIAAGRNTAEITAALHIRSSTARTHIQNILTKLGVHSRLEVAALVHALDSEQPAPPNGREAEVPDGAHRTNGAAVVDRSRFASTP
jgi:two-component system nitrate/nitrite response regulator NarL